MDLVMFSYFNSIGRLIRADIYLLSKGESASQRNAIEYVSLTDDVSRRHNIARRLAEEYGLVHTGKAIYKREYLGKRKDDTEFLQTRVLRYAFVEPEACSGGTERK